jgi:hypothetical protein
MRDFFHWTVALDFPVHGIQSICFLNAQLGDRVGGPKLALYVGAYSLHVLVLQRNGSCSHALANTRTVTSMSSLEESVMI